MASTVQPRIDLFLKIALAKLLPLILGHAARLVEQVARMALALDERRHGVGHSLDVFARLNRAFEPAEALLHGRAELLLGEVWKVSRLQGEFGRRRRRRSCSAIGACASPCSGNLRLPTYGGVYAWEFEKRGRELKVRVEGQLVFNNIALRLNAALAGLGLAYLPEDQVEAHLAEGKLVRVLDDWCPPFSGYHPYYPSRRQPTPAFSLAVDALRPRARSIMG